MTIPLSSPDRARQRLAVLLGISLCFASPALAGPANLAQPGGPAPKVAHRPESQVAYMAPRADDPSRHERTRRTRVNKVAFAVPHTAERARHARASHSRLSRTAYEMPRADRQPGHVRKTQYGLASWYGPGFYRHKTASGERFSAHKATAATRNLPMGTRVRVTNLKNGKSVTVRVNDRGPYVPGRIIDLSPKAAREIAMIGDGVTPVRIDILD